MVMAKSLSPVGGCRVLPSQLLRGMYRSVSGVRLRGSACSGGMASGRIHRRVLFLGAGVAVTHIVGCAPATTLSVPGRASPLPRGAAKPPAPAGVLQAAEEEAEPEAAEPESPGPDFVLKLPQREKNALTGSAFLDKAAGLGRAGFDEAVYKEIANGNVPDHQRKLLPVVATDAAGRTAKLHVLCDYLAVGTDDDFIRMPMTSAAAQRIADLTETMLPTPKLVDEIYKQAVAKLPPSYIDGGPTEDEIADFLFHHDKLEKNRRALGHPLGVLTAGDKKDIVLCGRLVDRPDRVAIYGWHKNDNTVIQPLSTTHSCRYADYSHGVRLIDQRVEIDGELHLLSDILRDADLASLVSDEGPLDVSAYPTTLPEYTGPSKKKTKKKKARKKTAAVAGRPKAR
jgi:hypothetical protein